MTLNQEKYFKNKYLKRTNNIMSAIKILVRRKTKQILSICNLYIRKLNPKYKHSSRSRLCRSI